MADRAVYFDSIDFGGNTLPKLRAFDPILPEVGVVGATLKQIGPVLFVRHDPKPEKRLRELKQFVLVLKSTPDDLRRVEWRKVFSMPVEELPSDHTRWRTLITRSAARQEDVCFIDMVALNTLQKQRAEAPNDFDAKIKAYLSKLVAAESKLGQVADDLLEQINAEADTSTPASDSAAKSAPAVRMAPLDPPAALADARALRDYLLNKSGRWFTSEQVAEHARGDVVKSNPHQWASNLRRQGRLFAVRHKGQFLHPEFQFDALGEPLPKIDELLKVLPPSESNWNAAFWLFQPTRRLNGRRPVDVFAAEPDRVIEAAEKDFRGEHNAW